MDTWRSLRVPEEMEDMVIPDVMKDDFLPKVRYPVDISIGSVSGRGSRRGVLGGH